MTLPFSRTATVLLTAMLGAATVTGQVVAGKALRDTLFLTSLDVTALPAMLIATSVVSLLLVALNGRLASRIPPSVLVPTSFLLSGALFLAEWILRPAAPTTSAVILYLHISAVGPLLASGFWLVSSERFDPRTAKSRFGQLAGAGTVGGLVSALAAERAAIWFGAPAMLPVLAVLQFLSAALVRRLAVGSSATLLPVTSGDDTDKARSGLRVVAESPHLRHLAALVLLGTTGAALVDYLFKAQAVAAFGPGDQLLRFFAIYYAATSVITFILQTSSSRAVLERWGLGATASTPSVALLLGSIGGLFAPGFGSLLVARGGESILRSSLFRAGYEQFYTPIAPEDKRAAKSLIDVAFDRLGDAAGGALVRLAIVLLPAAQVPTILLLAAACSAGAIYAASRLNRGYVGSLQTRLINHAAFADRGPAHTRGTRTLMRTLLRREARPQETTRIQPLTGLTALDATMQDILHLRSRDRGRVVAVLGREEGLSSELVPHVIPLLAWDAVAEHATFSLQKVAEEHIGQFVDALIDPNQDFAVRRRLARVFAVCVSQRAVDGLMIALDDIRFAVRCQAGRSLLAIVEKNPLVTISRERILDAVLKEVTVGRPVWEGRRLLDGFVSDSPLDAFVRDRAGESLAHVFTLLSLVLPREPIQLAFRGLQTDDVQLRGTALEYLDSVLPPTIKQRLWPFLDQRPTPRRTRPREEAIAALLRSHQSIMFNLEELRRRAAPDAASVSV
jgi:ATP:ADP antiporter, AAA family